MMVDKMHKAAAHMSDGVQVSSIQTTLIEQTRHNAGPNCEGKCIDLHQTAQLCLKNVF